jgi:hypothetical protein
MDETNFYLDQVSRNLSLLHFNSFFMHLFLFFGGHALLKRAALRVHRLSKDNPCMYAGRKKYAHIHTRPRPKYPSYTLKILKIFKMQELTLCLSTMEKDVCPLEGEGTQGH